MATKRGATVTLPDQLPIWPSAVRGLPNPFARSALFTSGNIRAGARVDLKQKPIAALSGISITYTGEELRQDDEDVFMQILHIARMHTLGTEVRFTAYSMLSELGWSKNGDSYKRLSDCLIRLKATALAVTVDSPEDSLRQNYTGSLIRSFRWQEEFTNAPLREWEILLEKQIVALFGSSNYTRVDWELRLQLSPMEKWLHSFYHTHANPYPYKVETLRELMGSKIKELRMFRFKLKNALARLEEVGFFEAAKIDARTDMVLVTRAGRLVE